MKKIFLVIITLFCVVGARAQSDSISPDDAGITLTPDQFPEFPGGSDSMMRFIAKTTVYPKLAEENGTQGTVKVAFVVEKDGSISYVRTIGKELGDGLEEEAIRVIKLMPKFKPAMYKDEPLKIKMVLPIKFRLK